MKKSKLLTDPELMKEITKDKKIRATISRQDHFLFFNIYFPHYITDPPALFHREMFSFTQRDDLKLIAIMAFRGSGKSTIMNLSYALWSILGKFQKKFVVIVSQTRNQAEGHFSNIRYELQNNNQLRSDLGPFEISQDPYSVLLKRFNAKIMFVSRGQSIRGMRHGPYRPSLIIMDDVEDSSLVESESDRNVTYNWFETEIMPTGDSHTTIVVLGNLLHDDSFLMRIRESIKNKKLPGIFRSYPLLDDLEQILWPEKFTEKGIQELKEKINNESAWDNEYLLKFCSQRRIMMNEIIDMYEKGGLSPQKECEEKPTRLGKYVISAPIIENAFFKMLSKKIVEDENISEDLSESLS